MVSIDNSRCTGCGRCMEACPEGFAMEDTLAVVKNAGARCVGDAVAACPVNAIRQDVQDDPSFRESGSAPQGFGQGRGMGQGLGRGGGRGMGPGRGTGMGRGTGGGRGGGRGGGGRGRG